MKVVDFRFHMHLREFLPLSSRQAEMSRQIKGPVSVKHLIEAAGVPHTEVEAILVNGRPIGFSYQAQAKDKFDVFPAGAVPTDIETLPLRPPLPNPLRFLLDNHLGRLANYLRILGFDTAYHPQIDDPELALIAADQNRILVTRDRGLLKRSVVVHGFCLRTRDSKQQLRNVLARFKLHDQIHPWRRCLRCNGRLEPISKEEVLHRLEPKTRLFYDEFHMCHACDHVYWKGSHYIHMQSFLDSIKSELP